MGHSVPKWKSNLDAAQLHHQVKGYKNEAQEQPHYQPAHQAPPIVGQPSGPNHSGSAHWTKP